MGTVSYSPSIVTMAVSVAVCEIFSVKEWCDLENRVGFVQGHWKWHHLITMAVSLAILEIFSVKEWPDLEIWVWVPSRSLRLAPMVPFPVTLSDP